MEPSWIKASGVIAQSIGVVFSSETRGSLGVLGYLHALRGVSLRLSALR